MRRGCIYRKLLTDLRRLSDEIPTDIKKSVGIPSELSNPKRLYNGHIYLSATVTWFVGIPSENTDGIPTTLLLIGMSSEIRRNIPTNFRRLQRLHFYQNVVEKSSENSDEPYFVGIPSEMADGIPTT